MMDGCAQALMAVLLIALAACAPLEHEPPPKPAPPFVGCKTPPPPLPPIATVAQVRARHDRLDKLYLDCSERARRNAAAVKE